MTDGRSRGARQPSARSNSLSRHRLRSWPQRLDLCGAGRRFDEGGAGLGGDRRASRAEGPAAWRRTRTGARHARRRSATPARRRRGCGRRSTRGDRLMGFGHRIYRVRDPRADALKSAVKALARAGGATSRLALAEAVEKAALEVLHQRKARPPAGDECRVLHRRPARRARLPGRQLHLHLRHQPHSRLDRACQGAGDQRPAHPAAVALCRPGAEAGCLSIAVRGAIR